MKTTFVALAVASFILAQTFAAPSEPKTEAIEDTRVAVDTTSDLIDASEITGDATRSKKSADTPKTICVEVTDREGRNFLQCGDSDVAGTSQYPSYSSAPSSGYGSPSSGYGSAPSSGYGKVRSSFVNITCGMDS